MGTLVILRDGRLVDLHPVSGGGTSLGLGEGGRLTPVPGDDPRALIRVTPRGEGLQVVGLPGAPPMALNERRLEGGVLMPGDVLRLGKLEMQVHPGGDGSLDPSSRRHLFELVSRAAGVEDPGELLGELLDHSLHIFGAERGFVLLRARPGAEMAPVAARHIDEGEVHSRISRTAVERAREAGAPVLIGDTQRELQDSRSTQLEGIRSILAAPLGPDGALYLDSRASTRSFHDGDLEHFATVAGYARLALQLCRDADQLRRRAARAEAAGPPPEAHPLVTGPSRRMATLVDELDAAAREDVSMLILGETGTGKEVLAREIHRRSRRAAGPFVAVHCMAFASEMIESELFGHEKGAFTGAAERRLGRFELADGGTLFLDEVGELSPGVQVKLLRVLQERAVERVGGGRPIPVDIRLVAATNQDLPGRIRSGAFREDLYYRINVFTLHPPPLRERREDIPTLAEHFRVLANQRMGKAVAGFRDEAMRALQQHDWPGNVRELANVVERAMVLARGDQIELAAVGMAPSAGVPQPSSTPPDFLAGLPTPLNEAREIFEGEFIRRALERAEGNVSRAAKELDVPRSTIYRKCELLGIPVKKS